MSEYQCYEFVALDRPLSAKQVAELRAISTRAEITPTRFWNEYQWGNLKADPAKLVQRYFDAHAYFANWGSRRVMFRLPLDRVDTKQLRAYFPGGPARLTTAGDHAIVDLSSDPEEPEDDFVSGSPLAALTPIRSELLGGDLRPAYLSWLLAVRDGDVADDALEPPVPRGLLDLSASLEALSEFLRIDGDLIAAAAEASVAEPDDTRELQSWVAQLSPAAKNEWLRRAVNAPELALGGELRRAFRKQSKIEATSDRRTVRQLRSAAETRRANRERAEAAKAAKAKKAAERARTKRLDGLATKLDASWSEAEALIHKSAYDEAVELVLDLRELARREDAEGTFVQRFEAMRKRQHRRRGFLDRWKRETDARRW